MPKEVCYNRSEPSARSRPVSTDRGADHVLEASLSYACRMAIHDLGLGRTAPLVEPISRDTKKNQETTINLPSFLVLLVPSAGILQYAEPVRHQIDELHGNSRGACAASRDGNTVGP